MDGATERVAPPPSAANFLSGNYLARNEPERGKTEKQMN